MKVVPHQNVRVQLPAEHRHDAPEDAQKPETVLVIAEDSLPLVAPARHVPDGTRKLQPKRPCQ